MAWDCPDCKHKNDDKQGSTKCGKCGKFVTLSIPCPKCKKPTPLGHPNCKHCSAKLPAHWICQKCGKICPGAANNCMSCGAAKPAAKNKPNQDKPKNKSPKESPKDDSGDIDSDMEDKNHNREEFTTEEPWEYPKLTKSKTDRRIKSLIDYYTKTYSKHLKSRDWFVRSLAVVALNKIAAKQTTSKLFQVLKKDKKPLVRLYAWECLRARSPYLTKKQHKEWVTIGARMASKLKKKNPFKGDLRVGLINALAGYGPSKKGLEYDPRKVVMAILKSCNPRNPRDSRTLTAIRNLVTRWHDLKLTKKIQGKLGNLKSAQKYEYVLGGLADDIEPLLVFGEKFTKAQWGKKRAEYAKWIKKAKLKDFADEDIARYTGASPWIPAPETIKNPKAKKWKEDLELEKLKVDGIDLCFAIDSTGSMKPAMQWLAGDLPSLINALELICKEPRVGAVYYRHEIKKCLMRDCCRKAGPKTYYEVIIGGAPKGSKRIGDAADGLETVEVKPGDKVKTRKVLDYRDRYYQLTSKIKKLTKVMAAQEAGGKHLNPPGESVKAPGAIHAGLWHAIKSMKWKKSKRTEKIIILIGDVGPTKGTMPHIEKLVKAAKKKNFKFITLHALLMNRKGRFHPRDIPNVLRANPKLRVPEFKTIMDWAEGKVNFAQFTIPSSYKGRQIATPPSQYSNYKTTLNGIIQQIIPEGYHKRIDPIVNVLCEYAQVNPLRKKKSKRSRR